MIYFFTQACSVTFSVNPFCSGPQKYDYLPELHVGFTYSSRGLHRLSDVLHWSCAAVLFPDPCPAWEEKSGNFQLSLFDARSHRVSFSEPALAEQKEQ